jgi:hypothetical protein
MKKKIAIAAALFIIISIAILHWYFSDRGRFTTEPVYTELGRQVNGNELISTYDPAVTLSFDPAFQYIGGQKFILYGVADTEQYFFIETHKDNRLKSFFWVQFEAYLPSKSYTYDYDDSPLRVQLGDYQFYTDTEVVNFDPNRQRSRGTDGAMMREFLASKGYRLPENWAYARLVYLTDKSRQKELMIIFIDDLSAYGLTASHLDVDGVKTALWPDVEQAHLERIRSTLRIIPNAK